VYFSYDLTGERVRKIYEHGRLVEERIYLGGYEVYRKRDNGALVLERLTLHVNDDRRRIALVETKTADASVPALTVTSRERFQVENQLGSSTMELDRGGTPFSYEEYYAFGTTSFRAADASIATGSKRYRYCGKERDEETGFYYYGARYHAAWLARWTSPDPAGIGAGVNGYVYCHNRPISMIDPDGRIAVLVVVGAALVGGGVGGLIGGAISGIHHGYVKQTTKGLGGAIGDGAKFGAVAGGGGLVVATFLPTVAAVAGVGGAGIGLVSAGAKQVVARTSPYPDDELIREANADSFTAVVGAVFSYLGVKSAKNSDVQAKAAENRASLRDAYQGLRTLWKGKSNAKPATPSGTTSMGDGGPSSGGPPPGGGEGGGEGSAALLLNIGGEGELAGYVDVNPLEGNRLLQDQIVAKNPTGKFVNARAESLPFKDGSAAEVVAKKLPSKVLGENAQKIASEIVRVLTPGGKASVHSETKFGDSTLQAFESAGFKCGPQICHYVKQ
jgi:RHS repeat-associated protein